MALPTQVDFYAALDPLVPLMKDWCRRESKCNGQTVLQYTVVLYNIRQR